MRARRAGSGAAAALTLVELLVTIGLIMILASLVLASASLVRRRAMDLDTSQRMEQVLLALSRVGSEEGGVTMQLQQRAGLGGTVRFAGFGSVPVPQAALPALAAAGLERAGDVDSLAEQQAAWQAATSAWHACWPRQDARDQPLVLAYPWGKRRAYPLFEGWYASGGGQSLPLPPPELTPAQRQAWEAPEVRNLRELRSIRSFELLRLTELLPADDPTTAGVDEAWEAYFGDRRPDRRWNDRWGNPLVVAYALFQPPANDDPALRNADHGGGSTQYRSVFDQGRARYLGWGRFLDDSLQAYGYNRSCYLAVAAGGPVLRSPLPSDPAVWRRDGLEAIWQQACDRCMQPAGEAIDPARSWTEQGLDDPPWTGVQIGSGGGERCFLTGLRELP